MRKVKLFSALGQPRIEEIDREINDWVTANGVDIQDQSIALANDQSGTPLLVVTVWYAEMLNMDLSRELVDVEDVAIRSPVQPA